MHDILNKLVKHKYLISFEIENNTLIVRYELSSVKDTTRAIDITNKTLSKAFQNSSDDLAVDILSCLVNKNDFYGYSNKKELNQRIKEETDYLTYLAKLIAVYEIEECEEEQMRTCSECGKLMKNGYVIENGMEYYCSDKCLHKNMTQEEYLELYDDGNGDSYWTEWED